MHDTAMQIGSMFMRNYLSGRPGRLLDLGGMNVNGSLRSVAPEHSFYCGADLSAGNGVDVVIEGGGALPFSDGVFDAVVSSSCFEHDPLFWCTFAEMVRVTRPGGYVYINTPSNGEVHRYPLDCWRFYPDSGVALELWAARGGTPVRLIESMIAPRRTDQWNDCILVFGREASAPAQLICDGLPGAMHVRRHDRKDVLATEAKLTEDQRLLRQYRARLTAIKGVPPFGRAKPTRDVLP
ncbi:methyltransferase domain-containing protein [Sediminicoccus sp. KRV36]|uniref:methyltransferase domain-containing protein n=1 Tax=Sediminicoccus sp. KRV36 TaxID=3133721 RepID=UPI00200D23D8|nr:methyltransferase domain-containing protein [Sediminicoccus rosea]UPY36027.1 class I SAM-dependent methyltransferase [Sediminicoccus rosea]